MNVLEHINKIPPFLCIAMARKGTKPIPQKKIAELAKLSMATISRMSVQLKWDEHRAQDINAVANACGVNLYNQRNEWLYLKKTMKAKMPFSHLGPKTRTKVEKLLVKLKDSQ